VTVGLSIRVDIVYIGLFYSRIPFPAHQYLLMQAPWDTLIQSIAVK
jgi:hypothetical protein